MKFVVLRKKPNNSMSCHGFSPTGDECEVRCDDVVSN